MSKTYGRVEYGSQSKKWRVIGYGKSGKSNQKLGEFDTRDEAIARLRSYIEGKEYK
jgi:hypothetical protein